MGPDSVSTDPTLIVKYERMTVYLLKALQESIQKARELEQRVAVLESSN